jgi:sulfopyruvate decarboxylase TPP-binding subunit
MRRYECLEWLASWIGDGLVVANSGASSRQWAHLRPGEGNFLSAGVGLVLPVSLGLALALPERRVLALEGDGSALMSASALAVLGTHAPRNLLVLVFDNEAYMEGARWPTATARGVDLAGMAAAAGVQQSHVVRTLPELRAAVEALDAGGGPGYVVAKIEAHEDAVPSDPRDMRETKYHFARHVEASEGKALLRPAGRAADASRAEVATGGTPDFADVVLEGLRRAGIDCVVSLPTTEFLPVLERCRAAPDLLHIEVANEGDGAGICAGTWLGGRHAALIVENHGLLLASYALTRCQATFGIPTVLVVSYRGHFDERFWWFNEVGRVTEPLLAALGIPARVVHRTDEIVPAIVGAARSAQTFLRPYAVALTTEITGAV